MPIVMLKDKVKEFLTNPANLPDLPERREKEIEGFGPYMVSRALVSLQNTRGLHTKPISKYKTNW